MHCMVCFAVQRRLFVVRAVFPRAMRARDLVNAGDIYTHWTRVCVYGSSLSAPLLLIYAVVVMYRPNAVFMYLLFINKATESFFLVTGKLY